MPSPYYEPNYRRTCIAGATVVEGTFVAISGAPVKPTSASVGAGDPTVTTAGAGVRPYGWAETGGVNGERLTILKRGCVPVIAAANLTAGQAVEVNASGQVIPNASGVFVGISESAVASGAVAAISFALA